MSKCCIPSHLLWRYFKFAPENTQGANELDYKMGKFVVIKNFSYEETGLSCYCENLLHSNSLPVESLLKKVNSQYKNYLGSINTEIITAHGGTYDFTRDLNDDIWGIAHCAIKSNPHEQRYWKMNFRAFLNDSFNII